MCSIALMDYIIKAILLASSVLFHAGCAQHSQIVFLVQLAICLDLNVLANVQVNTMLTLSMLFANLVQMAA